MHYMMCIIKSDAVVPMIMCVKTIICHVKFNIDLFDSLCTAPLPVWELLWYVLWLHVTQSPIPVLDTHTCILS